MPIGVNIPKAKELQKERFRQVRKPLLEALDIDYQRADEAGDASMFGQAVGTIESPEAGEEFPEEVAQQLESEEPIQGRSLLGEQ